ncbi:MAG: co-chaperone GroES, partial [Bacteroidales bacterium]
TLSGIYIPDTAKEKPQRGTIVAAGPGTKDTVMEVKVGDVVLYGKYAGTEITVDGKDYLIMKQSDILAVI